MEGNNVGLGSHTDLQLFTLLWQDMVGGLQVLNREGQWIRVICGLLPFLRWLILIFDQIGTTSKGNDSSQYRRLHDETQ